MLQPDMNYRRMICVNPVVTGISLIRQETRLIVMTKFPRVMIGDSPVIVILTVPLVYSFLHFYLLKQRIKK